MFSRRLAVACAAGLLFVALLSGSLMVACGTQPVETNDYHSFMESGVRPACVPLEGSINEPCERRLPWSLFTYPSVSVSISEGSIKVPISVDEEIRSSWSWDDGIFTPQIILRATVLPNSARCVDDGALIVGGEYHFVATEEDPLEVCYVEISVNEYIVGSGPGRLPVVAGWRTGVDANVENYGTTEYYDRLAGPIRESWEGIEFIFSLVQPANLAHGSWYTSNQWDVQRKGNGDVVGVSRLVGLIGTIDNLEQFEYPLAELQETMRTVHAKMSTEMGGRIAKDPDSPMLVPDASRESLLGQLRELGAYDVPGVTPVAAPLVPLPPVEPSGLAASPPNDAGGIPLSWTAPDSGIVSGYKVVRRVPKGEFVTVVADIGSTETTYTDASAPMTAGVTYIYRVIALNEYGESLASNRATVELPGPDAPVRASGRAE